MSEFNKYSTDGGATFIDVEDSNAVHWGDQSKGYVGKNLNKDVQSYVFVKESTRTHEFFIDRDLKVGDKLILSCDVSAISGYSSTTAIQIRIGANPTLSSDTFTIPTSASGTVSHTFTITTDSAIGNNTNAYAFIPSTENTSATITLSNIMIRLASISDATYEPYIHPNTEIPDKMTYADNAVLGAKNFFHPIHQTFTYAAEFLVDENEYISHPSGQTNDTRQWSYGTSNIKMTLPNGKYKVMAFQKTARTDGAFGFVIKDSNDNDIIRKDSVDKFADLLSSPISFTINNNNNIGVMYKIGDGSYAFMIWKESDTDNTFVPYAMTNRELTKVSEVPLSIPSELSSKITLNANSKVYRQGNVVTGSIRISITDTLSAGSDLCDLGGIKPKYLTYTSGIKNSDGSVMPVIQNTTGRIVLFGQFIPAVGSDLIIPINYMCE